MIDRQDLLILGFLGIVLSSILTLGIAQLHQSSHRRKKRSNKGVNKKDRIRVVRPSQNNVTMSMRDKSDYLNIKYARARSNAALFFSQTGMTITQFDNLLTLLQPRLQKRSRKKSVPPAMRLTLTLRYLWRAESISSLAISYQIGESTVHEIINQTTVAIVEELQDKYLKPLTQEDYTKIAQGFLTVWRAPNCVGALDCKKIKVRYQQTRTNGESSYNVLVLATCDACFKFTNLELDIDIPDWIGYGGTFHDLDFGINVHNQTLPLPPPAVLPNMPDDSEKFPYYFVADEYFPLLDNLIRPYSDKNLDVLKHRACNFRVNGAKQAIDVAFNILTSHWKILNVTLKHEKDQALNIFKSCFLLHNFTLDTSIDALETLYHLEKNTDSKLEDFDYKACRDDYDVLGDAWERRERLSEYFMSPEGKVEGQDEAINEVLL